MKDDGRARLIAALAAFPAELADAARAAVARAVADPPAADGAFADGPWGPVEVIRHLIAVEVEVHQARLTDLATHDDPRWDWVEPGPWPGEPTLTLDALLERFDGLRGATIATAEALDEAGWARTGTHSRLGVWDVAGLLRNAVDHDAQHLAGLGG